MKRAGASSRLFVAMILSMAIACTCFFASSCKPRGSEDAAEEAYELRMTGKATLAKELLEKAVAADPTNAAAWYELARTEHHIGLGNPPELPRLLEDMQKHIEKAVQNDTENVIYLFYRGYLSYLNAYAALQSKRPDVKEKFQEAITAYQSVLAQKPDYHEAMLYLVEIYTTSQNVGGDPAKAQVYAKELEDMDAVYGAKARELFLPGNADRVGFWKGVLEQSPDSADVLEQLGKAYLYQGSLGHGAKYLKEAMKIDPEKTALLLDLARYHMINAMGDEKSRGAVLPLAEEALEQYIDTEPVAPLEAYALGLLALVKQGMGDSEGAEELTKNAEALDPHYSKALGMPPLLLFSKPDEIAHYHAYFSRPF